MMAHYLLRIYIMNIDEKVIKNRNLHPEIYILGYIRVSKNIKGNTP